MQAHTRAQPQQNLQVGIMLLLLFSLVFLMLWLLTGRLIRERNRTGWRYTTAALVLNAVANDDDYDGDGKGNCVRAR